MKTGELKSLIATLPRLINASIADSTRNKYSRAWDQWEKFCEHKPEIVPRPADPFYIAVYFNYLLNKKGTRGSVTDAMYGIRWGHTSTGFYSPTDHPFVKSAYEGARRLSNYTGTNKKEPVTPSMLHQLIDTYGEHDNLLQQRTLIICLLGFSTFKRLDELLDVKVGDIKFYPSYMTIHVRKAKNDQLREGNVTYVSELQSQYCPVLRTAAYITVARLQPTDYLVCKLVRTKKGHRVVGKHRMSNSRIRKTFMEHATPLFPDVNIGLHGLRAGGASAAAQNHVSDRLISKHGRWASEKSRDGYIRDSVQDRLSITKSLGL